MASTPLTLIAIPTRHHHRSVSASCFGAPDVAPQFVALEHNQHKDFRYFFGELLLCLTCTHEGSTHELIFVEYLWARKGSDFIDSKEDDGIPLVTRYYRTARKAYDLLPAQAALFCAPLVVPPPFRKQPVNAPEFRVLNDAVYANF